MAVLYIVATPIGNLRDLSPRAADTLRTAENIMGLYDLSVGRGGNLLINIGPDRRGLLPEADAATYMCAVSVCFRSVSTEKWPQTSAILSEV